MTTTELLATPANMAELAAREGAPIAAAGVFAYSPLTGERYSASAGDYFALRPDEVLTDAEGEPMVLARESRNVVPIGA